MNEHFIYFGLGILAIYVAVIFGVAPSVNRNLSKEKSGLFSNIEKHAGKMTEHKFKEWIKRYEAIIDPKQQLISFYRFGIIVIGALFLAYFIAQTELEDLLLFIYAVIVAFGIIFGINLFSLLSWKIHQSE